MQQLLNNFPPQSISHFFRDGNDLVLGAAKAWPAQRAVFAPRPRTSEQLARQIQATDNQIDQLVYELYELTEEEIKIVEETV